MGVTPQKALRAFVLLTLITGLILFGEGGGGMSFYYTEGSQAPSGKDELSHGHKLSAGLTQSVQHVLNLQISLRS